MTPAMSVADLVAELLRINQPTSTLIMTEVDLNGDILIGSCLFSVRYDGFHERIVISGVMDPPHEGGRQILHGQMVTPLPLTFTHEQAIKEWAADDRLWTTQETVEFNLRTFARVILKGLEHGKN